MNRKELQYQTAITFANIELLTTKLESLIKRDKKTLALETVNEIMELVR